MSNRQPLPSPRLTWALAAALILLIANASVFVATTAIHLFGELGAERATALVIQSSFRILITGFTAFVVLWQVQRHLRRPRPARPLVLLLVFVIGMLAAQQLWSFSYMSFLKLVGFGGGGSFRIGLNLLIGLVSSTYALASVLGCAVLAVLAGGRHAEEQTCPPSAAAVRAAQMLTFVRGILGALVAAYSVIIFGQEIFFLYDNLPALVAATLAPLPLALIVGVPVFALWPRRLQEAGGLSLYALGWLVGGQPALPVIVALVVIAHGWPQATLLLIVVPGIIYLTGVVVTALLVGWLGRGPVPAAPAALADAPRQAA